MEYYLRLPFEYRILYKARLFKKYEQFMMYNKNREAAERVSKMILNIEKRRLKDLLDK